MNSQERVLAALRREQPDRVPWVEGGIDPPIQRALMGRDDFLPEELNDSSGPSPEASSGAGEHK